MYLRKKSSLSCLCASVVFLGTMSAVAPAWAQNQTTDADDSARNVHHTVTADQQGMDAKDRAITQQIRKSIVADHHLSIYSHNVKIITQNGHVTLKGPVHTEAAKRKISELAAQVAGSAHHVTNEISVQP